MGLFVGLKLSVEDATKIESFQKKIKLNSSVKKEDLHCTLFATVDNFPYVSEDFKPIKIKDISLGKIKTQKGVDCLAIFFESDVLKEKYHNIIDTHKVQPYYADFKLHVTLSYDCGDLDIEKININDYFDGIHLIKEYTQPLHFETDRRNTVR